MHQLTDSMKTKGISAVVIVSRNPKALRGFYEKIFNLKFVKESHGELQEHYFVTLENIRFIIHGTSSYKNINAVSGSMTLYFSVDSISDLVKRLKYNKANVLKKTKESFGDRIEFQDLDGNVICATQLSTLTI